VERDSLVTLGSTLNDSVLDKLTTSNAAGSVFLSNAQANLPARPFPVVRVAAITVGRRSTSAPRVASAHALFHAQSDDGLQEMTEHPLARGCQFLDTVPAKRHLGQLPPHSRNRKCVKEVIEFYNSQEITLLRLRCESSHARENNARLSPDHAQVLWTTRWRFRRPDKSTGFETVVFG
jgi:hypothetical protein